METVFPASFWPLALVHGFALLCPGPDFMLIVSHGIRHRLRGSSFICLGIVAGNAVYIALAIAGWTGLNTNRSFQRSVEIVGALYLGWLGARIYRSARPLAGTVEHAEATLSATAQFMLGIGSAILNPKNMVFYLAIMTTLIKNDASASQRIAAGAWMCGVVLLWDLLVAAVISRKAIQQALWKWIPLVEKVCGVLLILAAASVIIS